MPIHPKIDDETGLAYGCWEEGWKDVFTYKGRYEIYHDMKVRNKKTGKMLKPTKRCMVGLTDGKGGRCMKAIYHLVLEAFFPHIPRNGRTADHINEQHNDNFINNLQWLTRSQQTIKSHQLKPRDHTLAQSKAVEQWSIENPSKLQTFLSTKEAARQTGIARKSIFRCVHGENKMAGGYFWRFQAQPDLHGEEWKTSDALIAALQERKPKKQLANLVRVRISNLGRIRTVQGIVTKGVKHNSSTGYRMYEGWMVHQLVWIVWGDGRPVPRKGDNLVIMHNDEQEKDEDGCVSNAIAHLKLGTLSENSFSYHRAKAQKRMHSQMSEGKEE